MNINNAARQRARPLFMLAMTLSLTLYLVWNQNGTRPHIPHFDFVSYTPASGVLVPAPLTVVEEEQRDMNAEPASSGVDQSIGEAVTNEAANKLPMDRLTLFVPDDWAARREDYLELSARRRQLIGNRLHRL